MKRVSVAVTEYVLVTLYQQFGNFWAGIAVSHWYTIVCIDIELLLHLIDIQLNMQILPNYYYIIDVYKVCCAFSGLAFWVGIEFKVVSHTYKSLDKRCDELKSHKDIEKTT